MAKVDSDKKFSRRECLQSIAVAAVACSPFATEARAAPAMPSKLMFIDLRGNPSGITAYAGLKAPRTLERSGNEWAHGDIGIHLGNGHNGTDITLSSPSVSLTHVKVRWRGDLDVNMKVLGDHWERSYGDLEWRGIVPERVLPWYCAVSSGDLTHCYGVGTGARSLAFWQVDEGGISLWLDIRNGGEGVLLGNRTLHAATLISREGQRGETSSGALVPFCKSLCRTPRLPSSVIYGSNDWYYAYGKNTAEQIERDADLVVSLAPSKGPKPFTIVDDGWQNPKSFPSVANLAGSIKGRGARPGIWIRPLRAPKDAQENLLLPAQRYGRRRERAGGLAYDPTIPEARAIVLAKMKQAVDWGYELVKHDFSTYELLGQWGNEMGPTPTVGGWSFNDKSRTNAEIILDLYQGLRETAGDNVPLIGCNTMGHLAAGLFELNRTGDDVSGQSWERTRRMGVNTLAYRLPQNRSFFVVDADCVPITRSVPWDKTRLWLDLVARSGTALIISPEPTALDGESRAALHEAFAHAITAQQAHADDWMHTTMPCHWTYQSRPSNSASLHHTYDWSNEIGAWPYPA
jgi:alpha-galactosidase